VPLQPIYPKLEALPFGTIALDFITKLPESKGSDSILTITDHDCTKMSVFIPCKEEITTEETAILYLKHLDLCPNPKGSCATSWGLLKTSPWHITPEPMDNQKQ
jgi:hypothetical protein